MSKTLQLRHATASGPPDSAALVLINLTRQGSLIGLPHEPWVLVPQALHLFGVGKRPSLGSCQLHRWSPRQTSAEQDLQLTWQTQKPRTA